MAKTLREKLLSPENLTFIGAVLGVVAGLLAPTFSQYTRVIGELFLLLLKMTIIPLIFASVFLAVARQAGTGDLSRVGVKTLFYFLSTSALACLTGLIAVQLLPDAPAVTANSESFEAANLGSVSGRELLLGFFPGNPFKALSDGNILQIVVFSLILGVASARLIADKREPLVRLADAVHDLILVVIQGLLYLAPLGVFSLVAAIVARTPIEKFAGLGWFFAAVATAVTVHVLITLPLIGYFVGGFHPYRFMLKVREAIIMALATASSAATLPVSTRVLEKEAGVGRQATGFVLPLGATLNMDGSALYQALLVVFLGHMAGIEFSLAQQGVVFLFVMLSSAGTAGIPGGGIVMMGAMLEMVGIPLELLGVYLLVDRFWDPIVTAVNVTGDLFGTKTIDRFIRS